MRIETELKTLRILSGYSQRELADRAGVSTSTIRKMERGERVKLDVVELIAEALGKKIKLTLE